MATDLKEQINKYVQIIKPAYLYLDGTALKEYVLYKNSSDSVIEAAKAIVRTDIMEEHLLFARSRESMLEKARERNNTRIRDACLKYKDLLGRNPQILYAILEEEGPQTIPEIKYMFEKIEPIDEDELTHILNEAVSCRILTYNKFNEKYKLFHLLDTDLVRYPWVKKMELDETIEYILNNLPRSINSHEKNLLCFLAFAINESEIYFNVPFYETRLKRKFTNYIMENKIEKLYSFAKECENDLNNLSKMVHSEGNVPMETKEFSDDIYRLTNAIGDRLYDNTRGLPILGERVSGQKSRYIY